jgi:phage/plasmid-associated DNA primase
MLLNCKTRPWRSRSCNACGSLDNRRVASALSMAECEIPVRPLSLDVDPYLLNFLNGAVDLRTGELRPHDRADPITKLLALILLRQ